MKTKKNQAKYQKKHKKSMSPFFIIGLFLVIIANTGYWWYSNLEPRIKSDYFLKEGFLLAKPNFLTLNASVFGKKQRQIVADDSWINDQFSDNLSSELAQKLRKEVVVTLPSPRPAFRLVDVDKKQTTYQIIADLSPVNEVEKVEFAVWGDETTAEDLQVYEGSYEAESRTWRSEIPISNHKKIGRYQARILMTKKDGRVEETDLGEFTVAEPKITANLDTSRTDKGQFDVLITVDSPTDAATLEIPVWSKEDQSDLKRYEAQKQDDNTYKVRMDYEDFQFHNGVYFAEANFIGENGLTAHSDVGSAEIILTAPKRVRVLQDATVFQNRLLTESAKNISRNSMVDVEGIVYNDEQKIFKTTTGYISAESLEVSEKNEDIHYVMHRGNHQVAPENSLPSFQQATSWGVETDVQLTKDKQWVIMHDDSVDRMTNGSGAISNMTLDEVRKLRIDSGANLNSYDQSQLVVPTLTEFLTVMQSKQIIPFIEIKPTGLAASDYDSLASLISQYGFGEHGMVISFDYGNLQEIKRRLPNVHVQLLSAELNDQLIDQAYNLGAKAGLDINYDNILSKIDLVTKAQSRGLEVNAWTIPASGFKKVEALGVDYITTDFK